MWRTNNSITIPIIMFQSINKDTMPITNTQITIKILTNKKVGIKDIGRIINIKSRDKGSEMSTFNI
jgi:hypothetical protein